jgi:hypothetical protein
MIVQFGSTYLAPGDTQAADMVRVDGRQIVQEAQFFRGTAAQFYPRGNLSVTLQFVTHWIFNTTREAEVFVLTHLTDLPMDTADRLTTTCTCGAGSETQPIYLANSVLEAARILRYVGKSVDVEYTIRGPYFQTLTP